jgi:hypothetical protein
MAHTALIERLLTKASKNGTGTFILSGEKKRSVCTLSEDDEGRRKKAKKLLRKEKETMPLKSLESQNVEFKSNLQDASHWRDEAGGKISDEIFLN